MDCKYKIGNSTSGSNEDAIVCSLAGGDLVVTPVVSFRVEDKRIPDPKS